MASVAECVEKLVVAGKITRVVADKALGLHERMQAQFSMQAPPASSEAAAALAVAKVLRENAAARERNVANKVRNFQLGEQRITEHPAGREAGLMSLMTKDMWRTNSQVRALPENHPVKTGANVHELHYRLRSHLFTMLGAGLEEVRPGVLGATKAQLASIDRFIDEQFGVDTGDAAAKELNKGYSGAIEYGADRAQKAGYVFQPNEDWRFQQHWNPRRVRGFEPEEFIRDYKRFADEGSLKVFDKDTNKPVTGAKMDEVLRRAYSDIKTDMASLTPFSEHMRTFQFQPGQTGANAFKFLQRKYGVGDDFLGMVTSHMDHMARTIALQELGMDQGNFAGWMRLVREKPGIPVGAGIERFNPARVVARTLETENMLRNTFDVVTGKTASPANEELAVAMSGARNLIGASGLRNLPISIIPGDVAMTLLTTHHTGMPFLKVIRDVFDTKISKEAAAHLQISSHSAADYINNSVRKYEDELNYSGVISRVTRGIIKATGADLWTENIRRGTMTGMMNVLTELRGDGFDRLHPSVRAFLDNYGIGAGDWDKIRAAEPTLIGNARYYFDPSKIEPQLYERLIMGIHEVSSYMAHQPDARTQAFVTQGTRPGTGPGEAMRSLAQFKQFAVERMATHLMRTFIDDSGSRIGRGLAFTMLSLGAGAVSLQAAAAVAGKKPLDMVNPKFWLEAFTKGGVGGIYGDIMAAALEGDRGGPGRIAQLAGPLPGLASDTVGLALGPLREALEDRRKPSKLGGEAVGIAKRFSPNTWYTKLAVDRLLWDKLQTQIDPQYRQSFRRAEDRARKQGSGFWWGPGETTPGQ